MQEDKITVGKISGSDFDHRTLYGISNGQLEFMGMEFITCKVQGKWEKYLIMRFTDHDLEALPDDVLKTSGLKPYYELMFPVRY